MKYRPWVKRIVLAGALVALAVVAWGTLAGALHQLSRAHSLGTRVETAVQLVASLLSILVVVTCFWQRRWARPLRTAWAVSLAITSGLSALVWGPPMFGVALLFAAATLLVALGFIRVVRWAQVEQERQGFQQ
ncbi:MAG: hypothetical protein ACYCVL_13135 [Gemmatimonadaceae bacterium]